MASGKEVKNLKSKLDGDQLDLSLSEISVVPVKEIAALKKVTNLDLSSNHIITLPDDFCTLRNLVKLDLSSNKLRSLPEQFGKLENLQHLDLYKNNLEDLPVSFCHLKQLRWLDVKDNPLDDRLRKLAGDCLDAKQCKESATKVVQHMQKVNADRERDRQIKLKKQREVEAAEKSKEDEAKNAKAAEKKKEKDKKKEAKNAKDVEKHNENAKESKKDADSKRAAQRERGSTKQEKPRAKKSRGILGCITCLLKFLFLIVFLVAFLAIVLSLTLYVNCSRPSGGEFIPKTRELCQDLYQSLHTGRLAWPQSWDYKGTFGEIGSNCRTYSQSFVESVQKFDYVGWKNAAVDGALTMRDTIVSFSIWTYENGKPIMKQLIDWFWVAFAVAVWLLQEALAYAIRFGQWTIETATDVVNNFPAYWEKIKLYWKNLK